MPTNELALAVGLPDLGQEVQMKTTFYSLIVVSPQGTWFRKVHVSREAALILAMAFVLSFFATVALLLSVPTVRANDADHSRLRKENLQLKVETSDAAFRMGRLKRQVSQMEETSKHIQDLMAAD